MAVIADRDADIIARGEIGIALAGQSDKAIQYYRKALQWGDDDPNVRQALEELGRATSGGRRGLFGGKVS